MNDKLTEARKKINEIDAKMAELFIERMKAAEMVAEHKREHGLEVLAKLPIDPEIPSLSDKGVIELFENDYLERACDKLSSILEA